MGQARSKFVRFLPGLNPGSRMTLRKAALATEEELHSAICFGTSK
jgi:hypothetical protein